MKPAGEIAGRIGTDAPKKSRRKLTLQDRIAELDEKIASAKAKLDALVQRRSRAITDAKVQAEARAEEVRRLEQGELAW